jgi:AraC-like DNA-binding protein
MCRSMIGRDFSPIRIELRRSPPTRLDDHVAILRTPIRFNASETRLVLDAEIIERRIAKANPEVARRQDALALRFLCHAGTASIPTRVREVLRQRLSYGEPSEREVAMLLSLSIRELRRHLVGRGNTYRDILDDARRERAIAYLGKPHASVEAATYLLGYSSTAAFSRAFRQWTGLSPGQWRARS